jgi:hypothetical protein
VGYCAISLVLVIAGLKYRAAMPRMSKNGHNTFEDDSSWNEPSAFCALFSCDLKACKGLGQPALSVATCIIVAAYFVHELQRLKHDPLFQVLK